MSGHWPQNETSRDDIHYAVENENTHLLTLQVSRYCPLVLQSCTVADVPVIVYM